MNENFEKCVNAFNNSSLKYISKEEQKEKLGYKVRDELEAFIEERTGAGIFINTDNGRVSFEIAPESLPFEVIEEIYKIAKKYKK